MNYFRSLTLLLTLLSCAPLVQGMEAPLPNPNSAQEELRTFCPICEERIKDIKDIFVCNSCQSRFDNGCLASWIAEGKTMCPVCKKELHRAQSMEVSVKPKEKQQMLSLRRDKNSYLHCLPSELIQELRMRFINEKIDRARYFWLLKHKEMKEFLLKNIPLTGLTHRVALNKAGTRAISGAYSVWDLESGLCLRELDGHTRGIRCIALNTDGTRAISGAVGDCTLKLWDVESGSCLRTLEGHTDDILCVAINGAGTKAISGSKDRTLRLWDIESGICLQTLEGHTDSVRCVALNKEGTKAISGSSSRDCTLKLWDLENGVCLHTLKGHVDHVLCVAFNEEVTRAISGSENFKMIKIWDLEKGLCLRTLKQKNADSILCVALNKAGTKAISGSWEHMTKIWDVESGICLQALEGHTNRVVCVALNEEGTKAISGSCDQTIKIWDLQDKEMQKLLNEAPIEYVEMHNAIFEHAYNSFFSKEKLLDLTNNKKLLDAFLLLPQEMQEAMKKNITIILPKELPAPIPAPVAPAPAVAKQENSKESWKEWLLGKPSK